MKPKANQTKTTKMTVIGKRIVRMKINKPKRKTIKIGTNRKVILVQIILRINKIHIRNITLKIMVRMGMIRGIMIIIMIIGRRSWRYLRNKIVQDVMITSRFAELDNKSTST